MYSSSDVDRGWAFIIMVTGFLAQLFTLGLSYSSAVIYTVLLDELQQSPVLTAWTVNINTSILFSSGEIASVFVGWIGIRKTIVIGCVMSTLGLLTCCFARHLVTILILYGICSGIGFSFCYFPSFEVVSIYFRRYRAIAFGLCSCGAGVGQLIYPPLFQLLIDLFSWRGAFMIVAGINLNLMVVAAAFMPLKGTETTDFTTRENFRNIVKRQLRQQLSNFKLLYQPRWSVWCISSALSCLGISAFYTHISNYARVIGFSNNAAMALPSIIGISGLVARCLAAFLAKLPCIHVVALYVFLSTLIGMANLLITAMNNYSLLVICCILSATGVSSYGIYPESCIHILGASNVAAGVSYTCLSGSFGMLIGGPIAAAMSELDPSYRLSFISIGLVSSLAALLNLASVFSISKGKLHTLPSVEISEIPHQLSMQEECELEYALEHEPCIRSI